MYKTSVFYIQTEDPIVFPMFRSMYRNLNNTLEQHNSSEDMVIPSNEDLDFFCSIPQSESKKNALLHPYTSTHTDTIHECIGFLTTC